MNSQSILFEHRQVVCTISSREVWRSRNGDRYIYFSSIRFSSLSFYRPTDFQNHRKSCHWLSLTKSEVQVLFSSTWRKHSIMFFTAVFFTIKFGSKYDQYYHQLRCDLCSNLRRRFCIILECWKNYRPVSRKLTSAVASTDWLISPFHSAY